MWSIVLMGAAGLLAGGAISFRRQKQPVWLVASFWVLAAMALVAAWLLTLEPPAS
jgi:hypothetical protein